MAISNYLNNKLLDHTLKNTAYTSPTTVYIGLYTANDGTTGEPSTEVSGNGYSRQAVTFGSSASGVIANTGTVTFTASGGDFGQVISSAISDASSAGNILFYDSFNVNIVDGDSVVLAAGDISVGLPS
tara:strand:- start:172 stop:555 length:384 start_codon:yes stop_codon:yes gene_type:complete